MPSSTENTQTLYRYFLTIIKSFLDNWTCQKRIHLYDVRREKNAFESIRHVFKYVQKQS